MISCTLGVLYRFQDASHNSFALLSSSSTILLIYAIGPVLKVTLIVSFAFALACAHFLKVSFVPGSFRSLKTINSKLPLLMYSHITLFQWRISLDDFSFGSLNIPPFFLYKIAPFLCCSWLIFGVALLIRLIKFWGGDDWTQRCYYERMVFTDLLFIFIFSRVETPLLISQMSVPSIEMDCVRNVENWIISITST